MDTAEKDKQRLMAKLVYSGLLLVELFNRPLKKLVGSAHCRCTGHWSDKHLTVPSTKRGKKHFKRTKWGKIIVQRSKARGLYREISESREKEEKRKRKSENSRDLWSTEKWWLPFKTLHLLLIHRIASGIHQRRAGGGGGEGGTAETGHGRVPPDGRNVWELQGQNTGRASQDWAAADGHSWLKMPFSREGPDNRKAFSSAVPLLSRQIFTQATTNPSGSRNAAALVHTQLVIIDVHTSDYSHSDFLSG